MKVKITKKHAIIGIAVIVLIGVGFFFLGGAQSEDSSAGVKNEKSVEKAESKAADTEKSVKEESAKEGEKADATSEKNDAKATVTSEKKNNTNSNKNNGNKNNSNKNNSNKNNSNNSNKNNATGGNSAGSSSSGNSGSSSSSSSASKPAHTHSYSTPIYGDVYVRTASICSTCGADVTGDPAEHAKEHNLKGENGGHYSKPIYESRVIGYKCSCGAETYN